MTEVDFPDALPAGSRLHWYVLERVLGQGGFGITYLAHDTNLDRPVAIKEYLPAEIARRRSDASAWPHSDTLAKRYAWGLERFLLEARTLARFDHPNIVRVLSVFEANNTAYMVMRFEEGEDLATQLERRGTLPQRQLTDCLLPILDGLELVHAAGFIHRDIKPENIYVRRDGSPVLLDFGSARQSFGSAKTLTILVAPGYAPLEQYYGDASTQGPWTDIYGLGATCYRAIAGRAPLDAIARAKGVLGSVREILTPAAEVGRGRYDEAFLAAVDRSLQLSEKDRPQTIAAWRHELLAGGAPAPASVEGPASAATASTRTAPGPVDSERSPARSSTARVDDKRPSRRAAGAIVAALMCGAVALWAFGRFGAPAPRVSPAAAAASVATIASPRVEASASASSSSAAPVLAPTAMSAALAPGARPAVTDAAKAIEAPAPVALKNARTSESTTSAPLARNSLPATKAPASSGGVLRPAPASVAGPMKAETDPAAAATPTAAVTTAAPVAAPVHAEAALARSPRDEAIDAAEAALRRGDANAAAQILAPLAAAGVPRAQTLLGRAQEARPSAQRSDFEAYVWYGIAARNGQAGAQAQRERVAAKLQPAEIRQADQLIERWKPRPEAATSNANERTAP
ncbi:MAG TPA: protein kinase [Caldimonas sp.]|nr:protein kinase [Caldimonas sp.]